MATGRIPYTNTTPLGVKIRNVMQQGAGFRAALHELAIEVGRYNDASADISTDSGIVSGSVQGFKDLLARADGEMGGTNIVDVLTGAQSMTRTLLDSMA